MVHTISLKVSEKRLIEPDLVLLSIHLSINHKKMDSLLKQAKEQRGKLMAILHKYQLTSQDIRIERFHIHTNYNAQDHHRFLKANVTDYQFIQDLRITFSYEEEKLNAILNEIITSQCNVSTDISFSIKNKEAIIDDVIESLGTSAKRRAEQLLKGTDSCLDELHSVSYEVDLQALQRGSSTSCRFKEWITPIMVEEDELLIDTQPTQVKVNAEALYIWYIRKAAPSL